MTPPSYSVLCFGPSLCKMIAKTNQPNKKTPTNNKKPPTNKQKRNLSKRKPNVFV